MTWRPQILALAAFAALVALSAQGAVPPAVDNGSASNIELVTARLNGYLLFTGGAPTTVRIYWGTTDGGTNAVAWAHTNAFGVRAVGLFSTNITGLASNTLYYYRCWASNSAGVAWAPSSASFTTLRGDEWMTNGLVAYYPFNGDFLDAGDHGNDPYYSTATFGEDRAGQTDRAAAFNGTQHLWVSNSPSLEITGPAISIAAWVCPTQFCAGGKSDVVQKMKHGGPVAGYVFGIADSGLMDFGGTFDTGEWQDVAAA